MLTDTDEHTFTFSSPVMSGQCHENGTVCCVYSQENTLPSLWNLRFGACKYLCLGHKETIKARAEIDCLFSLVFKFVSLSMKLNSRHTSQIFGEPIR